MVDSIYIVSLDSSPKKNINWLSESTDFKTNQKYLKGKLKNLRVRQYEDRTTKIAGSLPMYLMGSNVDTLSRDLLMEAIEELCCDLGIDSEFTRIYAMDLAATLVMSNDVQDYFAILGHLSRFERVVYSNGILYKNTLRSLTFYDKGKKDHMAGNLLRIELKLKKQLKRDMGWFMCLSDLLRPDVFIKLVERWYREYSKVEKIMRSSLIESESASAVSDQIWRKGIEGFGGPAEICAQISGWGWPSYKKSRLKSKINKICREGNSGRDAALIEDLDQAVRSEKEKLLAGLMLEQLSGGPINL